MYLFSSEQQSNTAEVPVFFLKFQKRALELRDNETALAFEMLSRKIILQLEVTANQNMSKRSPLHSLYNVIITNLVIINLNTKYITLEFLLTKHSDHTKSHFITVKSNFLSLKNRRKYVTTHNI